MKQKFPHIDNVKPTADGRLNIMRNIRDLGSLGESKFKLLCDSVGLIANKSNKDKTGWDYYVEFFPESNIDDKKPMDSLLPPIDCKIQVKSSDSNSNKVQIKLSNLYRLSRTPLPVFFCLFNFSGTNEAKEIYLLHLGKTLISKTLKRIRELENKDRKHKLNKHTITLYFKKEHLLKSISGKELKNSILNYIPNGIDKYTAWKNQLIDSLGFENGHGILTIKVTGEGKQPITDLLDLTLGIRKDLEISRLIGYHTRFGIKSTIPFVDSEGGILSIPNIAPQCKADVIFKEHEFSSGISFRSDFYNTPLNEFVPKEYIKFRLVNKFFEFTFQPFGTQMRYSFLLNNFEKYRLNELKDIFSVFALLKDQSKSIVLEIVPEGKPKFTSNININNQIDDFSAILETIECCTSICHKLNIVTNNIHVSISSLYRTKDNINIFYKILYNDPKGFNISFNLEEDSIDKNEKVVCIIIPRLLLGNYLIGCVIGIRGDLISIENDRFGVEPNELILGENILSKRTHDLKKDDLIKLSKNFEKQFDDDISVVRLLN